MKWDLSDSNESHVPFDLAEVPFDLAEEGRKNRKAWPNDDARVDSVPCVLLVADGETFTRIDNIIGGVREGFNLSWVPCTFALTTTVFASPHNSFHHQK